MAMDYDEVDRDSITPEALAVTGNRLNSLLQMLAESVYIQGVTILPRLGGNTVRVGDIRITLKGLEYLNDNMWMKKAANVAKGIKETIPGL